ncbi:hypothetical protein ACFV84_35170 [Kitasatospora sp. NPDC059811]|uniref:hypothetical protein n=1 Tax=Kitasatospora sp. NPDC059811 TaxID=3346957 RepID=UPI0036687020
MHQLAAADTQLHLSVPLVLGGAVVAMVWKGGLRWWQAAVCVAAGLAMADSSMGGPGRHLMSAVFGWVNGLPF